MAIRILGSADGSWQDEAAQALLDIAASQRSQVDQRAWALYSLTFLDHHLRCGNSLVGATFQDLERYCYRVAGVVGEVAAAIFGGARSEDDRNIRRYAHELGLAFQLTNIIRDVGEDARRGRIYLPQDELARFGVAEADILNGRDTPEFQALMQFQYERANAHYDSALAALPAHARRAQRPGLVMAAIYRTLLDEIRRDHFPVLRARVSLTPLRKLWLAGRTWLFP